MSVASKAEGLEKRFRAFKRLQSRLETLAEILPRGKNRGGPESGVDALSAKLPLRKPKFATGKSSAKLFVIQARKAPYAVVLRRGPSKQVQLIGWRTDSDIFEPGQWFKGRIYERRCDLSPDGRYLVYFAAKFTGPLYSWTAVSKPPYFTALALWQKGDCWEGGGLFENARSLWLNDSGAELMDGFHVPKSMTVWSESWGSEEWPVYPLRLLRDGWTLFQPGTRVELSRIEKDRVGLSYPIDPPQIWERSNPRGNRLGTLRMNMHGFSEEGGDWNVLTFEIKVEKGESVSLGRVDWADWDSNGDLLYAQSGKLFRLSAGARGIFVPEHAKELADFNGNRFQAVPPPEEATRW
jgi:hypothetical protein